MGRTCTIGATHPKPDTVLGPVSAARPPRENPRPALETCAASAATAPGTLPVASRVGLAGHHAPIFETTRRLVAVGVAEAWEAPATLRLTAPGGTVGVGVAVGPAPLPIAVGIAGALGILAADERVAAAFGADAALRAI